MTRKFRPGQKVFLLGRYSDRLAVVMNYAEQNKVAVRVDDPVTLSSFVKWVKEEDLKELPDHVEEEII